MRIIPFRRGRTPAEGVPPVRPPSSVRESARSAGSDPGAFSDPDREVADPDVPSDEELAGPADPEPVDESGIPRWRRASLLAARHADPSRPVAMERLTFDDGAVAAIEGIPHTRVRYRLVELLAEPDETRAAIVGRLDEGDEVQIIETRGLYRRVRCPDGRDGWVHRMTLEAPAPPG